MQRRITTGNTQFSTRAALGATFLIAATLGASMPTQQAHARGAAADMSSYETAIANSVQKLSKKGEFSGITLRFATRHLPPMDFVVSHIKQFQDWTGATVQVTEYGENPLRDKIVADASSHAGQFDLYNLDGNYTPLFASNGWIQPLGSLAPSYRADDILPFSRGLYTYKGQLYGAPIYLETTILYYRKDLFKKVGIAKAPSTMDELSADAAKLTNAPRVYGISLRGLRGEGMNVYTWTEWLHSYGGEYFKNNTFTPDFNSPGAIKGTEEYAALIKKYDAPNAGTWGWPEVSSAFAAGRVGMTIESTAFYPTFEDPKQSSVAGQIGFAPVPAGPNGRWPANYTTGIAIASSVKDAKKLAAAKAFLQYGTSAEMETGGLGEQSIGNVARTSLLNSPLYTQKITNVNPDYASAVAADYKLTKSIYRPLIPQWKATGDIIGTAIEGVFTGQSSAASALNAAAADVTKLYKQQGIYGKPTGL